MEHCIATTHCLGQRFEIECISAQYLEAGMSPRLFQKRFLTSGEVVPAYNNEIVLQEPVDKIGSNKSGSTSDEVFHYEVFFWQMIASCDSLRSRSTSSSGSNGFSRSIVSTRNQVNGSRIIDTFLPSANERER